VGFLDVILVRCQMEEKIVRPRFPQVRLWAVLCFVVVSDVVCGFCFKMFHLTVFQLPYMPNL